MPGTQAQNVMWVALDEQLPPARIGVPVGLALALALVAALLAGAVVAAAPPDELGPPPLLHAASSVIAAAPAIPAAANRLVLLGELPFDNIWGAPSLACCRHLLPTVGMAVSPVLTARVSG